MLGERSRGQSLVGMMRRVFSVVRGRPKINPAPLIVLGNQKSGTSAIAHLLADYAGLSKTIDIPELWWPTLARLLRGEMHLSDLARRCPHRFAAQLIKEPNLTFFYDEVKAVHPMASFVFVVRDPRDNIRSLLNRLSLPGNLTAWPIAERTLEPTWAVIFDAPLWGWGEVRHYIDVLAIRWNRAVDVYREHAGEMVLVRYEEFIADKMGTIARLAEALGLPRVDDITDRLDIPYQPRGERDVSWEAFFGRENLARIERRCGERMEALGYSI